MTVPDQSMTVRELFQRFASGQELGGHMFAGGYEFDEDGNPIAEVMPDIKHMDYADQEVYMDERRANLEKQKSELITARKERKKKYDEQRKSTELAQAVQRELGKAKALTEEQSEPKR